ncbi:MAG TPA: enoyl-CoA hydratase-related protein [Mycobacteriales bacterium]|nr:enoyl-CoA hydratase-related protein [Mycobacteriales bacterium]
MTVDGLSTREEGQVLTLTIDRAEQQNSLTYEIRNAMVAELERASADLNVRAVVITAAGERAFCTGADLRSRPPTLPNPEGAPERAIGGAARMIRTGWQKLIAAILDCEKPVIAAVNGTAAGGGMHLALACDLVLMADSARFIEVFIRRGIIPDAGGAFILPRIIGIQKTKELMFFGDDLSAADAEKLGLVNKVVPAADLQKVTTEWAARLATMPTKAIGLTKALVNRSLSADRQTAFEEEAWFQEINNLSEDAKEGMMSFVERRPSEFKGW